MCKSDVKSEQETQLPNIHLRDLYPSIGCLLINYDGYAVHIATDLRMFMSCCYYKLLCAMFHIVLKTPDQTLLKTRRLNRQNIETWVQKMHKLCNIYLCFDMLIKNIAIYIMLCCVLLKHYDSLIPQCLCSYCFSAWSFPLCFSSLPWNLYLPLKNAHTFYPLG